MSKICQTLYEKPFLDYDFKKFKTIKFKSKEEELKIRYQNLWDVINTLNENGIQNWLQGKTMLGIVQNQKLLENDSDEDVGVFVEAIDDLIHKIVPKLIEMGFEVIRITKIDSMVSVMRNNRYLDICIFREKTAKNGKKEVYYELKNFPAQYYQEFIDFKTNDFTYKVPKSYKEIVKYSYKIKL